MIANAKDKCAKPCYDDSKVNTNLQTYTYPNSVYSTANNAVVGEANNSAIIKDSKMGVIAGVPIEDNCITGAAAPILDEKFFQKALAALNQTFNHQTQ